MTEILTTIAAGFGYDTFEALVIAAGWNLGQIILTILIGWLVMRLVIGRIIAVMERANFPDATVRGAIRLLLRWAVILLTAYYVMLAVGIQTTAVLGIITGSALAIGLAMQGTLSNVASGMMLLVLRPISVGDYILGAGHEGTVVTVGIFYTTIDTLEKYRVSIPNSALFSDAIINYSKNPIMTARLLIGVAYDADLERVKALLVEAVHDLPGVLTQTPPVVLIQDLGPSSVDLEVRFDTKREHLWPTLRLARQKAKETLDANGIEIPFPQPPVHYRPQTSG